MVKVTYNDKEITLTAKEKRLFDVFVKSPEGMKIGDICDICHTTPWTLLGKTQPNLIKKLELV